MLARNHIKQSEDRMSTSLFSTLNVAFIVISALLIALLLGIIAAPVW